MGSSIARSNPLTGGIETDHDLNKETARRIEEDSQYNAAQRRIAADKLRSEQIATIGSSGVELSGSVKDAVDADYVEAQIEAMNIVYSGKFQAEEMKARSRNQRSQAYTGLAMSAGTFGAKQGGLIK